MTLNSTRFWIWSLAITVGLFSCATQGEAPKQERPPERAQAPAKEPAPAPAKSAAQAPDSKQPQGPGIVKSQAGVPFMSGGIGVEERNQMRQAAKAYNLGLSFAGKSRGYLTNVSVVITDDKGQQVLSAANTGPWFYFLLIPAR
jgi:hypothetical protein